MLLFVMHTKLDQTGLSWFELATTNHSRHYVILRHEHIVPTTKLNADVILFTKLISRARNPHNNCLMLVSLAAHAVLGSPEILQGYMKACCSEGHSLANFKEL